MLSIGSGYLASRKAAIPHRELIDLKLKQNQGIINIDMQPVQGMSESFADELFGVLVVHHGQEVILNRLKLHNIADEILHSIANVVYRRHIESLETKPM